VLEFGHIRADSIERGEWGLHNACAHAHTLRISAQQWMAHPIRRSQPNILKNRVLDDP
jgi:hypothetical protein